MKLFEGASVNYFNVLCFRWGQSDEYHFSGMVYKYKKSTGEINRISENVQESFSKGLENINKKWPIICCFIGDRLLTRLSQGVEQSLFKDIDLEDFYFQRTISESGWLIETAGRKQSIDNVLSSLHQKGFFVIDFFLGPSLIPLENKVLDREIILESLKFSFLEGKISEIEYSDSSNSLFSVDEKEFCGDSAVILTALVHYLENGGRTDKNLETIRKQFSYFKLQRGIFYPAIGFLFVLLFLNFLIFSSYTQKEGSLKQRGNSRNEKISKIENLEKQLTEYSILVKENQADISEKYAFYSDRIAQLRPNKLWFDNFDIHPLISRIEKSKQLSFNNNTIQLTGETNQAGSLNVFINNLLKENWVEDIQILQYSKSVGNNTAVFKIKILIK